MWLPHQRRLHAGANVAAMGGATAAPFDPADLFGGANDGVIFDPSDLSTMWQNTGGTTPAVVDSAVARIDDISGKGHHATQATGANQPILRGTGGGAPYWLEFDGAGDRLAFALNTEPTTFDRVGGWYIITDTGSVHIVSGQPTLATLPGSGLAFYMYAGNVLNLAGSLAANTVVTERFNGASSRGARDNGSYTTGNAGTNSTLSVGNFYIGANGGGAESSNIRMYRMVMRIAPFTDPEIAQLRTWVAASQGRAL